MKTIVNYVRGGFGAEEILLDWNEIAEKYGKLSPSQLLFISIYDNVYRYKYLTFLLLDLLLLCTV